MHCFHFSVYQILLFMTGHMVKSKANDSHWILVKT